MQYRPSVARADRTRIPDLFSVSRLVGPTASASIPTIVVFTSWSLTPCSWMNHHPTIFWSLLKYQFLSKFLIDIFLKKILLRRILTILV